MFSFHVLTWSPGAPAWTDQGVLQSSASVPDAIAQDVCSQLGLGAASGAQVVQLSTWTPGQGDPCPGLAAGGIVAQVATGWVAIQ